MGGLLGGVHNDAAVRNLSYCLVEPAVGDQNLLQLLFEATPTPSVSNMGMCRVRVPMFWRRIISRGSTVSMLPKASSMTFVQTGHSRKGLPQPQRRFSMTL